MDPGEPLEECVRREVAEEVPCVKNINIKKTQVGLEVGEVSYIGSQHWPFPAGSVMIGCHAQVACNPASKSFFQIFYPTGFFFSNSVTSV
jgi:NAD+ diphosphatase